MDKKDNSGGTTRPATKPASTTGETRSMPPAHGTFSDGKPDALSVTRTAAPQRPKPGKGKGNE